MVTLWIGDFRTRQLQNIYEAAQQAAEYHYVVEDAAEYSWLKNNVINQLPLIALEQANVIIMLGFNDCVYSSVWNTFKINTIATQYANTINELISEYPNFNFYVCSVSPIDADYPLAASSTGFIDKEVLTEKITAFNKVLKNNCTAIYIDTYDYLNTTGFNTRDGIRYTFDTCSSLHGYIKNKINDNAFTAFSARIEAPDIAVDASLYWTNTSMGGENPFPVKQTDTGFTLPSSTAYAWGRFYEIIGEAPKLSTLAAKYWYLADGQHTYGNDGYQRGETPKVGAIACWQSISSEGFVAVVEQVKADGSIITSESDLEAEEMWQLSERVKGTDNNWGMDAAQYTFQGFIYCPISVGASKEEICTKNSYSITVDEMKPNAQYIYRYLSAQGWTLNAIAGLLGNLQEESKMSPAIWESIIAGSTVNEDGTQILNMTVIQDYYNSHRRYPGFGLVQWTPYSKYTDWCVSNNLDYWDIDSQLQRISYEVDQKIQWIAKPSKGYDLSFTDFISSTKSAAWLAAAFAFCYERPARSTGTEAEQNALREERGLNGDFWYSYLSSLSFDMTDNVSKITNFKLDTCTATQASLSFLVYNCDSVKYSLLQKSKTVSSGTFNITKDFVAHTFKNLTPVTEYTLKLEGQNAEGTTVVRDITFDTTQDYPAGAGDINFVMSTKSPVSNCTLNVKKPNYLGYWKANSGYEIYLIINHKIVKTVELINANKDISLANFTLHNYFGYDCKVDDTIQIGIRVWTKDTNGSKLYNDENPKVSRSIYLISSTIKPYISE